MRCARTAQRTRSLLGTPVPLGSIVHDPGMFRAFVQEEYAGPT